MSATNIAIRPNSFVLLICKLEFVWSYRSPIDKEFLRP
jgi:hypothetical protein